MLFPIEYFECFYINIMVAVFSPIKMVFPIWNNQCFSFKPSGNPGATLSRNPRLQSDLGDPSEVQNMTGWWLTYPSEKYDFVSWDDDIPYLVETYNIHVPNHQPVYEN